MVSVRYMLLPLFCLAGLFSSCGSHARIEPLLLERPPMVDRVVSELPEAEKIATARQAVMGFVKLLQSDQCQSAWLMLSNRYQQQFADLAGGMDEASKMFCGGQCAAGPAVRECNWVKVLLGPSPSYVTNTPPEMRIQTAPDSEVFFVVQRDGGYVSFLLVREGGGLHLEPIL